MLFCGLGGCLRFVCVSLDDLRAIDFDCLCGCLLVAFLIGYIIVLFACVITYCYWLYVILLFVVFYCFGWC